MLRRKCRRFEAKKPGKVEVFTVSFGRYYKDGDLDTDRSFDFLDEDEAIKCAKEKVESSDKDSLGIAEVTFGEWVYETDIDVDEDGERYIKSSASILGEPDLGYIVTSANKKTAQAWGLRADEYGSDDVTESHIRRIRRI